MKKTLTALLLAMVAMTAIVLSVYAAGNIGEIYFEPVVTEEGEILPMANCGNHVWKYNTSAHPEVGKHTFQCRNTGCDASMTEECYVSPYCQIYSGSTAPCYVCGTGSFTVNHSMEYVYDSDMGGHRHRCTALEEFYGACSYGANNPVSSCNNVILTFKEFKIGQGHYQGPRCTLCGHTEPEGYYMPIGHPNGMTNTCSYCTDAPSMYN